MDTSLDGVPGDNKKGLGIGDFFFNLFKGVFLSHDSAIGMSFTGVLKRSDIVWFSGLDSSDIFIGDSVDFWGVLNKLMESAADKILHFFIGVLAVSFDGFSSDNCIGDVVFWGVLNKPVESADEMPDFFLLSHT